MDLQLNFPSHAVACFAWLTCLTWLWAAPASSQILSPGPLARPHAQLEGLQNCTRCHSEDGPDLSNSKCTECHTEIRARQANNAGYHGRVKAQPCAECHRDHKGLSYEIIQWSPSQRAFQHHLTGWPLTGSHKKQECKDCHDNSRVVEPAIEALLKQAPTRKTFLGLDSACLQCHFDEHRGQEAKTCQDCHSTDAFKPVPKFDHKNTKFALTGKHRQAKCAGCHEQLTDTESHPAWPRPRSTEYMRFKDVPHRSCTDCHEDVHAGKFGQRCTSCHVTASWKSIKQGVEDTGFHSKTRFPLKGRHNDVACRACHGPFEGQKAKFKNMAFTTCGDCHTDAHVGQIEDVKKCSRCHNENSFSPSLFTREMHEKTRWPLEQSHTAVACTSCHTPDRKIERAIPSSVRQAMARQRRSVLFSSLRMDIAGDLARCDTCHKDPHGGQFAEQVKTRGCTDCHQMTSFRQVSFDHDQSRFPLTGKHKDTACGSCHKAPPSSRARTVSVVVYKPLDIACGACHLDIHVGQLAIKSTTDCTRCHQTTEFKTTRFNHDDPKMSRFSLEGKHRQISCEKCHPVVDVGSIQTRRYKPVPTRCADGHEDEHHGRFNGYEP